MAVWLECYDWVRLATVLPIQCKAHFQQHGHGLFKGNKQLVWLAVWAATI